MMISFNWKRKETASFFHRVWQKGGFKGGWRSRAEGGARATLRNEVMWIRLPDFARWAKKMRVVGALCAAEVKVIQYSLNDMIISNLVTERHEDCIIHEISEMPDEDIPHFARKCIRDALGNLSSILDDGVLLQSC